MSKTRYPSARAFNGLLPLGAALAGMALVTGAYADSASDAAETAKEENLPAVTVKDEREADTGSYQGGTTRIGKPKQMPRDFPQSLTFVTDTLREDRIAISLMVSLRNVAGLTFNSGEGGRIGDIVT